MLAMGTTVKPAMAFGITQTTASSRLPPTADLVGSPSSRVSTWTKDAHAPDPSWTLDGVWCSSLIDSVM